MFHGRCRALNERKTRVAFFGRSDDLHKLLEVCHMGSHKSAHNLSLAASNFTQLHLKAGTRFYWMLTYS